jgi:N-acetylmuramoyl-L-alanine amidase
MKKRVWLLSLFVFAVLCFADSVSASPAPVTPRLVLNGETLQPPQPPSLIDSVSMVPLRVISENLGYRVEYIQADREVVIQSAAREIRMNIGKPSASVNGEERTMTASPVVIEGTTLVPIRFVGETLGLEVYWDNSTKSAYLYTTNRTDPPWGYTPPGSGAGGLVGSIGTPDGTGEENQVQAEEPEYPEGELLDLRYKNNAVIVKFAGMIAPKSEVLFGPHRIAIDFPGAKFAGVFLGEAPGSGESGGEGLADGSSVNVSSMPSGGTSGDSAASGADPSGTGPMEAESGMSVPAVSGERIVTGHEALYRIRYAVHEGKPRIVLDLHTRWDFQLVRDDAAGELRIELTGPRPYVVVLDAGHGGSDPGAKSVTGHWEKDFNLTIVRKVRELLPDGENLRLVLTRDDDTYPTLDERIELANFLGADLFISVHANSHKSRSTNGTETYYTHDYSLPLAEVMHSHILKATGFKDNGVRTAGFKVTKYTTMPAVLLEIGYLSNSGDAKKLFTASVQKRVAEAIVRGIKEYLKLP